MAEQALQSGDKPGDKFLRWFILRPRLTLVLAVLVTLVPFITKPFNIDDPLFLWAARQIQGHPFDPYGFDVNWYGEVSPMWEVTKNPPLACYYLAVAATVLGWSEPALHFAFLLPSIAAILGTYRLACHFCNRPMFAACATFLTPVFLISSTTVMCDTLMLAFWVWAIVLWVEGIERDRFWGLVMSGLLMALAALTKYFGVCLVPLLFAYSFIAHRRLGRWTMCLLIPVIALAAYQWVAHALYGKGLVFDAGNYVSEVRVSSGFSGVVGGLTALAFTGGCLALATFLAPWLWSGRMLAGFATVVVLIVTTLFFGQNAMLRGSDELSGSSRAFLAVQIVFWAVGGASVLTLAIVDVWHKRDARSWLLVLWVVGTFLFAGFFNWIVNGRSILPMVPAVGILLARRLEQIATMNRKSQNGVVRICVGAGAALALLVARADFLFATAVRQGAEQSYARYHREDETLWFQGHWGFQYYMEKIGAKAVVSTQFTPKRGDLLAVPLNNPNVTPPDENSAHPWKALLINGPHWITTTSKEVGAGFYASVWGPLPFAFGRVPPERVLVYVIGPPPEKISEGGFP